MMQRSNYPIIIASAITGAIIGAIALNAITAEAQGPAFQYGLVVYVPVSESLLNNSNSKQVAHNACSNAGFRGNEVLGVGNGKGALIVCKP